MKNEKFFFWAVLFEGGMAVFALGVGALCGLNLLREIIVDRESLVLSILATAPVLAAYFVLKSLPFRCFKKVERIVRRFYREYMQPLSLPQKAVVAALAGIGEEMLFRGLIQKGILVILVAGNYDSSASTAAVIVGVSILFGAAHAVTKTYFFLAAVMSLYLGVFYVLTDNLLIPIAIHGLYDFFIFLVLDRELSTGDKKTGV